MAFGLEPLSELLLPDGTTVEEHDVVTRGDVLIGGQSTVEFGVRGRNVVAGERVQFGGHIEAAGDCRLDMWCHVADNVLVERDAYLGERVSIDGRLVVSGDLDIGDDVQIADGFEANGWIVIRNPMPTIVFLFIYLTQLLHIGEEAAAEELLEDLEDEDSDGGPEPLCIPRGARVGDDRWEVGTPATIGADCRLHGNIRATAIDVGADTEIFGSLRSRADITIDAGARIHGDVTTRRGDVTLAPGVEVLGDVACRDLVLSPETHVDGTIQASGTVRIDGDTNQPPD